MVVQVERQHAHEARERLDAGHDKGRRREHDLALAQAVAVDLRLGQVGDEIVARARTPRRHFRGDEVAKLLEGCDLLGVAAFDRLVGRDRQDDLAPDLGVVALGQPHGAEQQADRDLAREVGHKIKVLLLADPIERAVGDRDGRGGEVLDVALGEGGLAQRAQPVVPGRVGGAERGAGAPGQLVDHVALR